MKKLDELFNRMGGTDMIPYYIGIFVMVTILIGGVYLFFSNQNKQSSNETTVSTYSSSHSETEAEQRNRSQIRAKRSNELSDKYEKIIKQNRSSVERTIDKLKNEGFTYYKKDYLGQAEMYTYKNSIEGFEIYVTYFDSPNPQYNEVVLLPIEDTKFK